MIDISITKKNNEKTDAIVILINNKLSLDKEISIIDQEEYNGIIAKTISNKLKFSGKFCQIQNCNIIDKKGNLKDIIIIGLGNENSLTENQIEEIGGKIQKQAYELKIRSLSIDINNDIGSIDKNNSAALIASGILLSSYRFNKYNTTITKEENFITPKINIRLNNNPELAIAIYKNKKAIASGVFFARDCISEGGNILYPESYANRIIEKLTPLGVKVKVIGEQKMKDLGMGAFLAVGQGSDHESKMVIMQYQGDNKEKQPVCLVGKGVTFDSGGISLKPAAGMDSMKYDMSGSAAVVGLINCLALRNAKVNVVGIVGLAENMISGKAQRPGDVITTMSKQTVEVLNTDAEGRLVLCDCLTYLQENFSPSCIVDLATLTGAIIIALGHTYAGCFTNSDILATQLINASNKTNEKLWRMPMHEDYNKSIKSVIADIANISSIKGAAGSATAAHFLARFIKKEIKWAHLDIAGVAWNKHKENSICPKGATGFGVRLLNQFIYDNYESL